MIDFRERQLSAIRADRLSFIEDHVTQEAWVLGCRQRRFPKGARFFWALQEVWAPKGAEALEQEKSA
jgi:hypothetical protein